VHIRRLLLVAAILGLLLAGAPALSAVTAGEDLYTIPFHAGTVDPARDLAPTDPAGRDLVLVQWSAFGDSRVVHELAATGADLVQPLAPVNYLVWADAAQTRAIRQVDDVRFAGVLPPALRVAPSVQAHTTALRVTLVGTNDAFGLGGVSVRPRAFTDVDGAVVTVEGGPGEAHALAQHPRVYSVADAGGLPQLRDEKSAQVVARGTDQPLEPGYPDFLEEIGADGSGVVLANVDGGVDFNHPDLSDRIEACIDYSTVGRLCVIRNHDDVIGHGTHTLGVMVGTGASIVGDVDGYTYGQGMAPGATAVVQNALHTPGGFSNAFGDGWRGPYTESYELGAIVSGNSWGPSGSPRGYDDDTREFDTIPRDIVDDSGVDDPQAFVLSIMNGGGGTSTQG
jgi:serine protease AprX